MYTCDLYTTNKTQLVTLNQQKWEVGHHTRCFYMTDYTKYCEPEVIHVRKLNVY